MDIPFIRAKEETIVSQRKQSVSFFSSDARLCSGFHWAKKQALAYVRDDAPIGPCYESALPGRDSFCMRDASHQAGGAHCLGLQAHNRNVMEVFARHISADRDFCSYWEITTRGTPTPVDYTDDSDFWYNLPANFDVADACSRLYDLTGDQGYLLDPVMANFHRMSVEDYLWTWDRDQDGIVDRVDTDGRRGIASYDEGSTKGYSTAADALSLEYAAFMAVARMYALKGEEEKAAHFRGKAQRLQNIFCGEWWNAKEKHFYAFRLKNGEFSENASYDNALTPLRCGIIRDPEQLEGQLDYLLILEPRMNVEVRSYLPAILWHYGRNADAMRIWLKMTAKDYPRREYPEISYAAVESLIFGYMGVQADAAQGVVRTRSAVEEGAWAQVFDLPLWGGSMTLKHEGLSASELTNLTGRPIQWEADLGGRRVSACVQPGQTLRLT